MGVVGWESGRRLYEFVSGKEIALSGPETDSRPSRGEVAPSGAADGSDEEWSLKFLVGPPDL